MSTLLVDTDVASFLLKGDTRAGFYQSQLTGNTLALSYMTVAELYQWAHIQNWGQSRLKALESYFTLYTLLPMDLDICRLWATVRATLRGQGIAIAPQDAWIAATALRWQLSLVTNNAKDYKLVPGLTIITHP